MIMHEYGDKNKPAIMLIHGMWMYHAMLLPYIKGMMQEYRVLAPDLGGHGDEKEQFISCKYDTDQILKWLEHNNINELELCLSASMGGVVAMYLAAAEDKLRIKCNVMEGASITRVPFVENIFYLMLKNLRDKQNQAAALGKLYDSVSLMDDDLIEHMCEAMDRTDNEALKRMVHSCNSFEYERCPISEQTQKNMFFEFGSKDTHVVAKKLIKKYYPHSTVVIRKGYGHCVYMFEAREKYEEILREYMRKSSQNE